MNYQKVEDLKFDDIPYDAECTHLDDPKPGQIIGVLKDIKCYCIKIAPTHRILQKTDSLLQSDCCRHFDK